MSIGGMTRSGRYAASEPRAGVPDSSNQLDETLRLNSMEDRL